jgi:hypothetical protein
MKLSIEIKQINPVWGTPYLIIDHGLPLDAYGVPGIPGIPHDAAWRAS